MKHNVFLSKKKYFLNIKTGDYLTIKGREAKHIILRKPKIGNSMNIINGQGLELSSSIVLKNKNSIVCKINKINFTKYNVNKKIIIAQALVKNKQDKQIISSSTELGIYKVVPWKAERSIPMLKTKEYILKKHARWTRIIQAAAKQSHNIYVPKNIFAIQFNQLINLIKSSDLSIVLDRNSPQKIKDICRQYNTVFCDRILLIIGPEGGITSNEIENMIKHGCKSATLGSYTLRSSTAVISSIAILKDYFSL